MFIVRITYTFTIFAENVGMENLPEIISAVGAILAAWFAYNQYTKNKLTDIKIEQWKKDESKRADERSAAFGIIYGELWHLLSECKCKRVYVVQPHPLGKNRYISISLEVKRAGITSIKPHIQNLEMSDFCIFSREMATRDFLYYTDVESQVKDRKMKALLTSAGSRATIIKRLTDERDVWVGSLFCGFTESDAVPKASVMRILMDCTAERIEYILPEIKERQV